MNQDTSLQICDSPISAKRKDFQMSCGLTVAEMLEETGHGWILDDDCPSIITIEGGNKVEFISKDDCYLTYAAPSETIGVNVIPTGGGSGGKKNPLTVILSIVVIAAATVTQQHWITAGYVGGAWGAAVAAGVVTLAGSMAINAIAGGQNIKSASGISENSQTSSIYTITGTQNTLNKYGPLPTMVGGTTRIWPTLVAEPYTEVSGEDQYLRQRFGIIGPVALSDFKIGETDIDNLQDVEIEFIEGFEGDATPTLYADGQDISEQSLSITLLEADGWATRTTQTQTKEIIYDVGQTQLFTVEGSTYVATSVVHQVSYRETDTTGDWLAPDLGEGSTVDVGDGDATQITISGYYTNSRLFSFRFTMPEGQYDVRWRRITADHEDDTDIFDGMTISTLRSIAAHPGIDLDRVPPMCIIDLRIKASGQLTGVVDQFNCIASAYLPVYDGVSAVNYELSESPAWAYFNILYGLANKKRITDLARYDFDALIDWATLCDAQGWKVNGILDTSTTVYKALTTVASLGRASMSMVNNKYSIAIDWEKDTIIQVFTPRNSWGFESTKAWPEEIDAIRANFVDEDSGYELTEGTVYADGYTEANAERFLNKEIQYATNWDQVWKYYRYELADRALRPELFSFFTDIENLRCTRGDRVKFVHDVVLVGLGQARIKSVTLDGSSNVVSATIDSTWTLDATTPYAVNIQRLNGSVYETFISNPAVQEDVKEITFSPVIPAAVAPVGGELIAFGEAGEGVGLDVVIHEIIPGTNLTAKLVVQDYAPGIQAAASVTIGEYESHIVHGRDSMNGRPNQPVIDSIQSDENVLIREADGSLVTRTILSIKTPDSPVPTVSMTVQYRPSENSLWETVGTFSPDTTIVNIDNLQDGFEYDFRAKVVSDLGSDSEWYDVFQYTVIGKTTPPPSVDAVTLSAGSLFWSYSNKPVDHKGYVVRFSTRLDSNWDNATQAHEGILPTAQFDLNHFSGNGLLFLVKAVDLVGLESVDASTINPQLGSLDTDNILDTIDYDPLFPGSISGGTISGGDIIANALSLYWSEDSAMFWGIDTDKFWPDLLYSQLVYEFSYSVPSEYAGERILLETTIVGDAAIFYRKLDNSATFWADDSSTYWGTDSSLFWHTAANTPEWLPWPGSIEGIEEAQYQFKIDIPKSETQSIIDEVAVIIDADSIIEIFTDVAISAAGTRVPLSLITHAVTNVQGTPQGSGTGISVVAVDKNVTSGPLIKVFDDTGTAVSGVVDLSIGGY